MALLEVLQHQMDKNMQNDMNTASAEGHSSLKPSEVGISPIVGYIFICLFRRSLIVTIIGIQHFGSMPPVMW